MRTTVLYIIFAVLSANCVGKNDSTTLNLQQIEFKDKTLTNTILDLSKQVHDCFNKNDFYVLDFFQSSLSSGEYYLSIDRFDANNNFLKSISYYVIINDIVFFVSSRVATDIINVLPSQKEFDINNDNSAIIGGDYHFLIWRTISGYYYILLSTCSE